MSIKDEADKEAMVWMIEGPIGAGSGKVKNDSPHAVLFLVAFCGGFFGTICGGYYMKSKICNEAINAGVAHYTADPATGEVRFEWIKPEGEAGR